MVGIFARAWLGVVFLFLGCFCWSKPLKGAGPQHHRPLSGCFVWTVQERWGFPQRLWPLLWGQLRRENQGPLKRIGGVQVPPTLVERHGHYKSPQRKIMKHLSLQSIIFRIEFSRVNMSNSGKMCLVHWKECHGAWSQAPEFVTEGQWLAAFIRQEPTDLMGQTSNPWIWC